MTELLENLSGKLGTFHPIKCDMSVEGDILEAFDYIKNNIGPISILINNAGMASCSSLSDGDAETWKSILAVNVLGKQKWSFIFHNFKERIINQERNFYII